MGCRAKFGLYSSTPRGAENRGQPHRQSNIAVEWSLNKDSGTGVRRGALVGGTPCILSQWILGKERVQGFMGRVPLEGWHLVLFLVSALCAPFLV